MDASSFCASFPVYLMPPAWGAHPISEQRWCVWSGHQMRGRANRLGLPNCSVWKQSQRLGLREGGITCKAVRGFVPRVCSPQRKPKRNHHMGRYIFFHQLKCLQTKIGLASSSCWARVKQKSPPYLSPWRPFSGLNSCFVGSLNQEGSH